MENVIKACMIVRMIFLPMMAGYINMSLNCDIWSRAIYNVQFLLIKWQDNTALIIRTATFNACVESWKIVLTYSRALVITIQPYLHQLGILTYIYTIYRGNVNPVSYHIVRVSHCQEDVSTLISRRIHSMCTMW